MIIEFTIENWMSYRDPTSFTMVPNDDPEFLDRIPESEKLDIRLLPIAAMFGGNASGKSNFVSALNFARNFILNGYNQLSLYQEIPFKLDEKFSDRPSKFNFKLLIDDTFFEYEFSLLHETVVFESLSEVDENNNKISHYTVKNNKLIFSNEIDKYFVANSQLKLDFSVDFVLNNLFSVKPKDILLLTHLNVMSNIKFPIYDWFKNNLKIFTPDLETNPVELYSDTKLQNAVNNTLKNIDCGIDKIEFVEHSPTEHETHMIRRKLRRTEAVQISNRKIVANRTNGDKIDIRRLVAYHKTESGEPVKFEIEEESAGTKRTFDLLPSFLNLSKSDGNYVYVFDELDSSLHIQLVQKLLEAFLNSCDSKSRSQLIFTTHNVQLMDLNYLRRDEMWLTEKDKAGVSDLFSLGDFRKVEDKQPIRESYLDGRFGGIPKIFFLTNQLEEFKSDTQRKKNVKKKK